MKKFLIIILFLNFNHSLYPQSTDQETFNDIGHALGFIYGTNLRLDYISINHPSLSSKALSAKLNLRIAHGGTITKIEKIFEEASGSKIDLFYSEMQNRLDSEYSLLPLTFTEAETYLLNFDNEKIRGNCEECKKPIGIILSHNDNYISNPAKELTDNYRNIFHSDDHPKSKGLNFSLEYPKSWSSKEGKRPNVIKTLSNKNKDCIVTIVVADILPEMGLTYEELSDEDKMYLESVEFAKLMLEDFNNPLEFYSSIGVENVTMTDFKNVTIDSRPAVILKCRGNKSTVIDDFDAFFINYMIWYNNYLINYGFMINLNKVENIQEYIQKNDLLSRVIANSIVIKDQWER